MSQLTLTTKRSLFFNVYESLHIRLVKNPTGTTTGGQAVKTKPPHASHSNFIGFVLAHRSKDFPPDVDDGTNTSGCLLRLWGGKVWDTLLYSIVNWDGNELFNNVLLFPFRRCRYPHKIWYYTAVPLNLTSHLLHNLEAHPTWKCKIPCTFLTQLEKVKVNGDKCPSYLPVTNDAFWAARAIFGFFSHSNTHARRLTSDTWSEGAFCVWKMPNSLVWLSVQFLWLQIMKSIIGTTFAEGEYFCLFACPPDSQSVFCWRAGLSWR